VSPETLEAWTLEVVRSLVEQGAFETDRFDFKEMLPHPKDEDGKRRLRRDVAAFANSKGGFLVVGVKNDKGLPVDERLVGVPSTHDFPEQFGNYPSACEPSVEWTFKNNPPIAMPGDRVIHVVHIATNSRRPHGLFEDGRWWFCKRTNKGTESLSYDELRALYIDLDQRRANASLVRSRIGQIRILADRMNLKVQRDEFDLDVLLTRFSAGQLTTLLVSAFGDISSHSRLVKSIDDLMDRCAKSDAVLAPMAAFAMQPRDRSYSGGGFDGRSFVRNNTPQIVMGADHILQELARLRL
jgi:hypothetical protein